MSRHWNNFCIFCTGNIIKDIRECDDRDCPFFQFRQGGLEKEVERDICKKLLKEVGVVK